MNGRDTRPTGKGLRVPELAASAMALVSVMDTWFVHRLAPVFWAALLLGGALALAALRGRRKGERDAPAWAVHHAAAGLLLIAVLQIASIPSGSEPTPPQSGHAHGTPLTAGTVVMIAAIAAIGYAVLTVFVLPRFREWRARMPVIAMAAIVMLMAGSIIE